MPSWKKIISSGSDAALNSLTVTNGITSSLFGTASYATTAGNGGVTKILAGSNVNISPVNGLGDVTVTSFGTNLYNTATGSYGSFYDTGSVLASSATTIYSMSLSTTDISNGVYVSASSGDNTRIKFTNAGTYNVQFSAQFSNTDNSTQDAVVWVRKNGTDIPDSSGTVGVPPFKAGSNGQALASWNYYLNLSANDFIQLCWHTEQANVITLETIAAGTSPTHPRTPSLILTAQRVDTFLSNTGSFSGSFTGTFTGSLQGTASYAISSSRTISSSYALTSSYVLNAVSASFASTASFVTTLNQNVLITGSLTVGTGSIGISENTITLGARDSVNEGGQLGLNAPGGTYTSASFIDNWQNQFRILRGTNATSDATVANWNLHTKQMQLPQYTNASSFVGTATANLAVDSGGNIITVSTTGGSVFPYTGNAVITGSLTTTGIIFAQPNGGMYFQGGDDAALYDINVVNTMGIYGVQNSTLGAIKLGSSGPVLYGSGSNLGINTTNPSSASLTVNGNVWATSLTGSLLGTASFATTALSASFASTASFLNNTTNAFIQNGNSFGATATLGTNDNQPLALETNGSTRLFVSSSGNVGIGTLTPQRLFDVFTTTNTSGIIASFGATLSNNNFSGIGFGYVEQGNTSYRKSSLVFERTETHGGGSNASGKIHFLLNNNGGSSATAITDAVVTIDSVGGTVGSSRMGIGTRFPTASLHISGTVATDNLMRVQSVTGAEYFFISSSGNVGIGNNVPVYKLQIDASGSANTALPLALTSIDTNNRVGILFGSSSISSGRQHKLFHRVNAASVEWIVDTTAASSANWNFIPTDDSSYAVNIIAPFATGGDARLYAAPKHRSLTLSAGGSNNHLTILSGSGNVGIGITSPSASFHVAGTTILSSSFNTAISGSTLKVQGSGSGLPIFTVVGSQGELFSINDSLSGSLFSVNDISGLPILEVFSDNTILLGNYQAPTLYTTNKIASSSLGSNVIYSFPTSSYDGVFIDYTVKSGSNARAGNFTAIWSGTSVNYMDNSTTDFGSTAGMILSGSISGSNLVVFASGSTAGWTFKGIIRSI